MKKFNNRAEHPGGVRHPPPVSARQLSDRKIMILLSI